VTAVADSRRIASSSLQIGSDPPVDQGGPLRRLPRDSAARAEPAVGPDTRADRDQGQPVEGRNRRTALALVGWIALLMGVSLVVIWLRN
jgi:hypothetical protein